MHKDLTALIQSLGLGNHLLEGRFGIEVEEHRLTEDGHLSTYAYPAAFGSRSFHPTLQSDFGESQMELVTLAQPNETAARQYLDVLQTIVHQHLQPDEVIWPMSMPPFLSAADKQYISTHFERPKYQAYREYLEKTYGLEQELITGIHLNASIPDDVFHSLYQAIGATNQSEVAFRNTLYFRIAQNLSLNRWLITYFFGAAPISENQYWRLPKSLQQPVRSIRSSSYGFSNTPDIHIGYQSLKTQAQAIDHYVATKKIFSNHEFYGPVRVKTAETLAGLQSEGIQYLEMRMFDLDPFAKDLVGIDRLTFMRLMFVDSLCIQPPSNMDAAYKTANYLNETIALGDPNTAPPWFADKASRYLDHLAQTCADLLLPDVYASVVLKLQAQIEDPTLTIGARLAAECVDGSLIDFGIRQGQRHKQEYLQDKQCPLPVLDGFLSRDAQLIVAQGIIHGFQVQWHNAKITVTDGHNHQVFEGESVPNSQAADRWYINHFGTIDLK